MEDHQFMLVVIDATVKSHRRILKERMREGTYWIGIYADHSDILLFQIVNDKLQSVESKKSYTLLNLVRDNFVTSFVPRRMM